MAGLPRRRGFVLITVLWVLVAGSVVALAATLAGREGFDAERNRIQGTRAYWRAQACVERVRFVIDRLLETASAGSVRDSVWRSLARAVPAAGLPDTGCRITVEAAGTYLDVNAADDEQLTRVFVALGADDVRGRVDAILDWRDADDEARPAGAERGWYVQQGRLPPRNAPFGSARELEHVRSLEAAALDGVLGVERGRLCIATAPGTALAAIPGFTAEAVQRVLDWRSDGRQVTNLLVFAGTLSPQSADSIIAHFPEISRVATLDPDAWIIAASATTGLPSISATVEVRLVRADRRAAVVRRRAWR